MILEEHRGEVLFVSCPYEIRPQDGSCIVSLEKRGCRMMGIKSIGKIRLRVAYGPRP